MRRKQIRRYLDEMELSDKQGQLTRDEQIDLWFKQMMFKTVEGVEDESEKELAPEIDYSMPTTPAPEPPTNAFNRYNQWIVDNPPLTVMPDWNEVAINPIRQTTVRARQVATLTREVYEIELEEGVYDGLNHRIVDSWIDQADQNWVTIEYDPR